MKKWLIPAGIILLLILAVVTVTQIQARRLAAETKFQTSPARRGSLVATIGGTGTVRANQSATLTWETSGTVAEVLVGLGGTVSSGQQLAHLETASLPQNVILAQAELTEAQRAMDDLYTNADIARTNAMQSISKFADAVRDAQYKLDNFAIPSSQSGLEAIQALDAMKEKLDAARDAFEPYKFDTLDNPLRQDLKEALDLAQADYNAAVRRVEYEYNLDAAEANLDKARLDYEKWKDGPSEDDLAAAQARVDAAKATLGMAQLSAPFTGTITEVQVKAGDQVSLGSRAFRLDDLSSLLVDVEISEVDINRVQPGQDVLLSFDAILSKEYHGTVIEVALVGTTTQGVVDFIVTVELVDADDQVKPGMTAAASVVVSELGDVMLVPNRAVRLLEGKRVIYILKDGTPEAVEITLGASSDEDSEVLTGELQEGDPIVLNPPAAFEHNGPPPFVNR